MKSNIYKKQEKSLKRMHILFGILAVLIGGNSAFARNLTKADNTTETVIAVESDAIHLKKPALDVEYDTITWSESYKKTIEEVIKENNLIIESNATNEAFPLNLACHKKTVSKGRKETCQNCFSHKACLKN